MDPICERIQHIFKWICQTPHPSGKESALAQQIQERLDSFGGQTWQDQAGNLICDFPASAGHEDAPLTAIQAHLDMVCAIGKKDYVPERDPIELVIEQGWIGTGGKSSLGADCGAGIAVMLWLAEHFEQPHPPLRLIFTVQEEVGLLGAQALDPRALQGVQYLINTDGFHWGRIVTGCASGVRERYTRPLTWAPAPNLPKGCAYRLTWKGLKGGHSGFDIGKQRANAILLMGELLRELRMESPFALSHLEGGTAFNAIPYTASAHVLTIAPAQDAIEKISDQMVQRWKEQEPEIQLEVEEIAIPDRVWNGDVASGVLTLLGGFADGVYARHDTGTVSDSSNLGHIWVQQEKVCVDAMMRCMDIQAEQALQTSHRTVCAMCGFEGQVISRYPAWKDNQTGKLCEEVVWAYHTVTGQNPEITVQHVGLEPAWLLEKNSDMQCICMGMEILNCHSPNERWKLDTISPFVKVLCKLLEALCVI